MLFFTNKKWTYEYAIELSTGVVKTFKSFIKKKKNSENNSYCNQ